MEESVSLLITQNTNLIIVFVMEGMWQDIGVDRFYFEKAHSLLLHLVVIEKKEIELNGKRKIRRGSEKGVNHGGWKLLKKF